MLIDKFDIEDEVGPGRNGGTAMLAIGQLPGDKEAALAAYAHAFEALVPSEDDAVGALGELDGLAAIEGGVEFSSVFQPASVVDFVDLSRGGQVAGADGDVLVAEGEFVFDGSGYGGDGFGDDRCGERRGETRGDWRRVVGCGPGCGGGLGGGGQGYEGEGRGEFLHGMHRSHLRWLWGLLQDAGAHRFYPIPGLRSRDLSGVWSKKIPQSQVWMEMLKRLRLC